MPERFLIVVFDYNKIDLFFNNAHKIKSLNAEQDSVLIVTSNPARQYSRMVQNKCKEVFPGVRCVIKRRRNWGIDQGGKLDFVLRYYKEFASFKGYLWMQDHFLDTTSPEAFFPPGTKDINGKDVSGMIKDDVIASEISIDLNEAASRFQSGESVFTYTPKGLLAATLENVNLRLADGGNMFMSASVMSKLYASRNELIAAAFMYDGTYAWTLFMEVFFAHLVSTVPAVGMSNATHQLDKGFLDIYARYHKKRIPFPWNWMPESYFAYLLKSAFARPLLKKNVHRTD